MLRCVCPLFVVDDIAVSRRFYEGGFSIHPAREQPWGQRVTDLVEKPLDVRRPASSAPLRARTPYIS